MIRAVVRFLWQERKVVFLACAFVMSLIFFLLVVFGPLPQPESLVVLAVVIGAWWMVLWRNSPPSVAMFKAIAGAMRDLQRAAVDNVLPEQPEGSVAGFNPEKMLRQAARVGGSLRLVYTVEHHEEGFLHTASSQLLRPRGHRYHTQCTFIIMLALCEELKECGISEEDVSLDLDESELGTQFVHMKLTAEQHARFVADVLNKPEEETARGPAEGK